MKKQSGYLLLAAVGLITLLALLSATIVSLLIDTSDITGRFDATNKSAQLATSGLEQGQSSLTEPNLSLRSSCQNLSSSMSLSTGDFTVNKASDNNHLINPKAAYATLVSANTSTTIEIDDSSVFAPRGRVLIDKEIFEYGNNDTANNQLTLIKGAQDGSFASSHPTGALVSQYQCTIDSQGTSPTSTTLGRRNYQLDIQQPLIYATGSNGTLLSFNQDGSELSWQSININTNRSINDIDLLNYHFGFSVNDRHGNRFSINQLIGGNWQNYQINLGNRARADLHGVSTVSSLEA